MTIVRPEANSILEKQRKTQEQGLYESHETSFYITIEFLSEHRVFILMFWSQ